MMQFPPLKTPAAAEKTEEESRVREAYRQVDGNQVLHDGASGNRSVIAGMGAAEYCGAGFGFERTCPVLRPGADQYTALPGANGAGAIGGRWR